MRGRVGPETGTYVEGDLGKNRGRVKGGRSQKKSSKWRALGSEGREPRQGAGTGRQTDNYPHVLLL